MESQNQKEVSLFRALEAKGWFRESDCLYPPHKTFCIKGDDPTWHGALPRMYERFKAALEKMPQAKHLYPDSKRFEEWVEDMESFVGTLEELVGNESLKE